MKNKINIWDGLFIYTIISIVIGFLVGAIMLIIAGIDPMVAYGKLIEGIFSKPKFITYSITYASPYIFTGLSVAFAFKTGVFNIGAEGQFVMGALAAVLVGIFVDLPPVLHAIVAIIAAAIAMIIPQFITGQSVIFTILSGIVSLAESFIIFVDSVDASFTPL